MYVWTDPSIDGCHSSTDPRISTRDTKTMNLFNDKLQLSEPAYPFNPIDPGPNSATNMMMQPELEGQEDIIIIIIIVVYSQISPEGG